MVKREELLAWIGIVLAVPPIVYMVFSEGKWAAGAFVLLLLAALIRQFIEAKRDESTPTFTVLSAKKRYTHTSNPVRTTFENQMRIRVNHHSESFTNSHLGGDGTIENIKMDGAAPDEVIKSGRRTDFVKKFPHQFKPKTEFDLKVTYDLVNGFPASTEGVSHTVEYQTEYLEVTVIFQPNRRCFSGQVIKKFGGEKSEGAKCKRMNDGLELSFTLSKPAIGSEHTLEWNW